MSARFDERMAEKNVRSDTKVVAGLASIYCRKQHGDRLQTPLESDAAALGVYGRRAPVLCEECAEHIRYAEKRRAFCPKDPKPFCAHCDTHCFRPDEAAWQRSMMRFAGPRSIFSGFAIPAAKHALEARAYRRAAAQRANDQD